MIQPGGFVDLRAPTGSQAAEDSVWPSFTDIMTVIVMIFLMALVVILIRNVDLVRQLRLTIELEQEAAAQSDTAALRVATLGDEIAALELRLGETDARRLQAESIATDRQQKIGTLLANIAALEQVREQLTLDNSELASSKDSLQGELLSMGEKQQALERLGAELKIEVAALALERNTLIEEGTSLTAENTSLRQQLRSSALERQQLTEAAKKFEVEREQYRAESTALGEENVTLEQKLAELVSLKVLLEQRIESLGDEKIMLEEERADLVERNSGLNQKLSTLTQFQVQLEAQVTSLASAVAELEEEKTGLLQENRDTTAWLANLLDLKQSLESDKAKLKESLAKSEVDRSELRVKQLVLEEEIVTMVDQQVVAQQALLKASGDLSESEKRYRLTEMELEVLRSEFTYEVAAFKRERELLKEELDALEILKETNTDLEERLNRLIRPARNKKGKHVVWVRQFKDETGIHYSLADPELGPRTELPVEQLYEQLDALKNKYGKKLFVRTTTTGDTLTYNEASKFTSFMRCQYDYYDPDKKCIKP